MMLYVLNFKFVTALGEDLENSSGRWLFSKMGFKLFFCRGYAIIKTSDLIVKRSVR